MADVHFREVENSLRVAEEVDRLRADPRAELRQVGSLREHARCSSS